MAATLPVSASRIRGFLEAALACTGANRLTNGSAKHKLIYPNHDMPSTNCWDLHVQSWCKVQVDLKGMRELEGNSQIVCVLDRNNLRDKLLIFWFIEWLNAKYKAWLGAYICPKQTLTRIPKESNPNTEESNELHSVNDLMFYIISITKNSIQVRYQRPRGPNFNGNLQGHYDHSRSHFKRKAREKKHGLIYPKWSPTSILIWNHHQIHLYTPIN